MPNLEVAIKAIQAEHGARKFNHAVDRIRKSAKQANESVVKTDKTVNNFGKSMKSLATGFIGAATAWKVFRFGVGAVKEFAQFEKNMANVSTMLNKQTRRLLPAYSRQIITLSKQYGQTTQVLSKGLYDILSASIDTSEALRVLEISTQAAIGGMTDAGVAADAITTVLNAYGLAATEAGYASDLLFAIVKRGKITFGELASGIGKVASIAATSGMSLEEVGAAIATMTRAGIQSDIAMTSLRAILMTFISPTRQNIDAAKRMGFELSAETLAAEGLTGVVQKLIGQAPTDVAGAFSNARGLAGLAALLQGAAGHMGDLGDMSDSTGSRLEAFGQHVDTTAQDIARGMQIWTSFKREIGQDLLKHVATLSDLSKLLDEMAEKQAKKGYAGGAAASGSGFGGRAGASSGFGFARAGAKETDADGYGYSGSWGKPESIVIDIEEISKRSREEVKEYIKYLEDSDIHVQGRLRQLANDMDELERERLETLKSHADFIAGPTSAELAKEATDTKKEELLRAKAINDLREKRIGPLKAELDLVGLTTQERDRHNAKLKFESAATKTLVKDIDEITAEYLGVYDALVDINREKSKKEITGKYRGELEQERLLLGLTTDERERAIKVQQYENELKEIGIENTKELTQAYRDELEVLQEDREVAEVHQQFQDMAERDFKSILRTPMDAAFQDTDMEEMFKKNLARLGQTLTEYLYEVTVVDPIMKAMKESIAPAMKEIGDAIMDGLRAIIAPAAELLTSFLQGMAGNLGLGGLFGGGGGGGGAGSITGSGLDVNLPAANGLVFNNANVTPFADGGVLSGPTLFPMANGGLALGGEAGPEALMPLSRGADGKLGVENKSGASESEAPTIVNVLDESMFDDYLSTGSGEKAVINLIRRNATELGI